MLTYSKMYPIYVLAFKIYVWRFANKYEVFALDGYWNFIFITIITPYSERIFSP